ncbi:MAG: sensor histidine kinase [Burkholderiales bacterium]|nr:sensor histidine kinase [Burkholderiales bacterium]
MFHTIFSKLVAVLLLFGLLMCLIFAMIMRYSHEVYHQEAQQNFHSGLAARLVTLAGWTPDGWRDPDRTREEFSRLVAASPQFHIYLLDLEGRVLAHYPDQPPLATPRVSLLPVKNFLQANPVLPMLGDDPAQAGARQIFSAAQLPGQTRPERYLYVTLHSEEHDKFAASLRFSYITREGSWLVGASLMLALAGGLLSLRLAVNPLKQLAVKMDDFRKNRFRLALTEQARPIESGDEIDILSTNFHRMAEQMQTQMQELAQADSSRREFITNVSHDLRTPLASIQGYLDTLILKNDTLTQQERQQYLLIALNQTKSLNQLITTLFYLAKLDSGQKELQAEQFKIDELLQDVVQKFSMDAHSKQIRLTAETQSRLPFVYADLGLIERALSNLIDNALRHTPEGGAVQLRLQHSGHKVWVSVVDSGPGILASDLPHIFERFYRGQGARPETSVNAGLGLSIVRRILDLHGESIEAAAAAGQGATFRFSLAVQDGQHMPGDLQPLQQTPA